MQDVPRAVVAAQRQLRREVPDLEGRFRRTSEALREEVAAVRAEQAAGGAVPELAYADVAAGRVSEAQRARIKRRGCVVIRGVFDPDQIDEWNAEILRYVDDNHYAERAAARTGGPATRALQMFGLYWSRPQMLARQAESQATTRAFLNRLWTFESGGVRHFDPDRQVSYADRVRRRQPGDTTLALPPHSDGSSVERWCAPRFQRMYREVLQGDPLKFDPFDAADRAQTEEIPSPNVCSAFRTFQGWTALSRQGPGDGTLQLVPIAQTMPWMLLRALQSDVPEGDLCGATPGRSLRALPAWHALLLDALVSIPRVDRGDTVWWHSELIHGTEDRHDGSGDSNVLYIAAAPWCDKNAAFLERQAPAFLAGRSGPDFPVDDYEVDFQGRARLEDLSPLGQRQMGLLPWA
ncbi:MAG TPA: YbiU family protein [Kofleriaceae bacterium]|jgi:hypothetical protein|nr:YbiU family protein [Kofleriaceae bacterium]